MFIAESVSDIYTAFMINIVCLLRLDAQLWVLVKKWLHE